MSYGDARNFFQENPSAGRVEFVFNQRVDLLSKPDATIAGYLYARDAIQGRVSLDPLDRAFGLTEGGTMTPLESPSALLDVFRSIEPSAQISRFKYSTRLGFVRSRIG